MKMRIHSRIAWPYVLTLVLTLVVWLIFLPLLEQSAYQRAQNNGTPVDLSLVHYVATLVPLVGLLVGLSITLVYTNRYVDDLKTLTETAKELGEGKFQQNNLSPMQNSLQEMRELSEALQKTAHQIEDQIAALSKERAMLSAVLGQMTDGVLIADDTGRVQLLNKAAEKLFMIREADALDRSVVEVVRHHRLVELWEETRGGPAKTISMEMGSQHKYLQVVGIPLGEDLPGRSMLLFQDLTQTHRLETIRRDFVSNISHELRTPMAGLKAISETLLDGALEDPTFARKFVLRMDSEVDNLTQMVNELLELSRIESGRSNFDFQHIEPCRLIQKPVDRMALQAERVGLTLSHDCSVDLPLVFADPERISQVFINLIHNAIKFTPNGGRIHVSAFQDGQMVVFKVSDNGVGIAQKDITRIFERFYKADRARSGGGTGLGLSICRHIVDAHGGRIWAESAENSGSDFFFSLPVVYPENQN
jgi:two-component system phosphate regulon sensor histidine kinase PhoR